LCNDGSQLKHDILARFIDIRYVALSLQRLAQYASLWIVAEFCPKLYWHGATTISDVLWKFRDDSL